MILIKDNFLIRHCKTNKLRLIRSIKMHSNYKILIIEPQSTACQTSQIIIVNDLKLVYTSCRRASDGHFRAKVGVTFRWEWGKLASVVMRKSGLLKHSIDVLLINAYSLLNLVLVVKLLNFIHQRSRILLATSFYTCWPKSSSNVLTDTENVIIG